MSDEGDDKPSAASASGISPEMIEYLKVSPAKKLENGIASGSLALLRTEVPFPEPARYPEVLTDGVWGIHLKELKSDHGIQLCGKVLLGKPKDVEEDVKLENRPISEIASEISKKVEPEEWEEICRWAAKYASQHPGHHDVYLRAIWVREFEEPMSAIWLAATAVYARLIEKNDFAYGYLVALLDQKLENETDFLRGKKVVEGAARSNADHAEQRKANREKVISTMRPHITEKHPSINRAARLAFEAGVGKSADANRKTYQRYA